MLVGLLAGSGLASAAVCHTARDTPSHHGVEHQHDCARYCPMRSADGRPCPMHAQHDEADCTCARLAGSGAALSVLAPPVPAILATARWAPQLQASAAPAESPGLYRAPAREALLRPPIH